MSECEGFSLLVTTHTSNVFSSSAKVTSDFSLEMRDIRQHLFTQFISAFIQQHFNNFDSSDKRYPISERTENVQMGRNTLNEGKSRLQQK